MYSYQERVLSSDKKLNVVLAARRTGKTELAIHWLGKKPNEKALFFSKYAFQSKLAYNRALEIFDGQIMIHREDIIVLKSGTIIYFKHRGGGDTRGLRLDRLVIDDAENMKNDEALDVLVATLHGQTLILGSKVTEGSVIEASISHRIPLIFSDVHCEEYSHLDALHEGVYESDYINQIKQETGNQIFYEEFGPWNRLENWADKRTNRELTYLLKKD